jgi:hypothetical protein
MEIDGDQKAAAENAQRKIGRGECEPRDGGSCKKNPVGAGNEFQYAFLNFHDLSAIGPAYQSLRLFLIASPMLRKPAAIPSTIKINISQGEVSKYRSRKTPIPSPMKIDSATESPRLLKKASSRHACLVSRFMKVG